MEILNHQKQREIKNLLKETYGLNVDGLLLITGENKIRLFQGSLDEKEIARIIESFPVESIGLYLGKLFPEGFRLSFDAASLLSGKINKSIIEIKKEDIVPWFKGGNLNTLNALNGFHVIKHNQDVLGCAKISQSTILNYVPKEKRVLKGVL